MPTPPAIPNLIPGRCAPRRAAAASAAMVAAACAALTSLPVHAQSIANGADLYLKTIVAGQQSCAASACHGSNPAGGQNRISRGYSAFTIQGGINDIGEMRFLQGHLTDSELNDLAAYIADATGNTPVYIPVAPAPAVQLSRTSLSFGSVTLGMSASLTTTLTNSGNAALTISGIASNQGAFVVSDNCGATLAASANCTINVDFTPAAVGAVSGTLTLTSDADGSPHTVGLSGTGVAQAAAVLDWQAGTGDTLTFADTDVGSTSASQSVTLTNSGTADAQLTAITAGGTNDADFDIGGTCAAGGVLTPGAQCQIDVQFMPTAAGARSATLEVTSDAANPPSIALQGTATTPSQGGGGGGTGGDDDGDAEDNENSGGGGCTLGRADSPVDPLWALMLGLAGAALWRRQRRGHRTQGDKVQGVRHD